jgi:hypothetical protein
LENLELISERKYHLADAQSISIMNNLKKKVGHTKVKK